MDAYQKEIAMLRERVAYLEGEVEYLKDILSPKINPFAGKLGFSPQQALLAHALYRADVLTEENLDEIMEGHCHQLRAKDDLRIAARVKVTIFKLRQKLAAYDIRIQTVRTVGYAMSVQDKQKLAKVCNL